VCSSDLPEYLRGAAFKIGAKIRCDTADDKELLECFREKPATDFVDVLGYEVPYLRYSLTTCHINKYRRRKRSRMCVLRCIKAETREAY
jgi:hypothetical protein